jgi:uncharacterized OB-fold protein
VTPGRATAAAEPIPRSSGRASWAVEEVIAMAGRYRCEKCGKTSTYPGNCCGEPMKKTA